METTQRYHLLVWRLFLGAIFALSTNARAENWPEDYVVHHDTESPDGHYGIVVPADDAGHNKNYLADLKTHQVLGEIAHSGDYFEGENHRLLSVVWAKDSTWCVAKYEERYEFGSIVILEPKRVGLTEIEIGKRIDQSLGTVVGEDRYDSAYCRCAAGRKLLVRAFCFTAKNPKMEDETTQHAKFEGTFDLKTGKWTKIEAQKMKLPKKGDGDAFSAVYLAILTAYSDYAPDVDWAEILSDKVKADQLADQLDGTMNEVYQGVHAILPAARFEKVKKDQIEWLKKRDAASSVVEKCKLMEARIGVLRDLLW